MAHCWTCGTVVGSPTYRCPSCEHSKALRSLRDDIRAHAEAQRGHFSDLASMQELHQRALEALHRELASGLSGIASAIEWGFQDLNWELAQQTDVLRSIDRALRSPAATKANEWREMGEQLRNRGVLDEAERFFRRALKTYPLDFRTYVGLAQTYLQADKFAEARRCLEESIPHAPKEEIDYRSYSYRLIGHIYSCNAAFWAAYSQLRLAIQLSPDYADALYDFAQYAAQAGQLQDVRDPLRKAVLLNPTNFELARLERNFDHIRPLTNGFLSQLRAEAIQDAEGALGELSKIVTESRAMLLTLDLPLASREEFDLFVAGGRTGISDANYVDLRTYVEHTHPQTVRQFVDLVCDQLHAIEPSIRPGRFDLKGVTGFWSWLGITAAFAIGGVVAAIASFVVVWIIFAIVAAVTPLTLNTANILGSLAAVIVLVGATVWPAVSYQRNSRRAHKHGLLRQELTKWEARRSDIRMPTTPFRA